jgi:TatD DNase family protein
MLVDSHCHLDYFTPLELPEILSRAAEAGVAEMVTIGTTLAQSERLPPMTEAVENLWCTIGTTLPKPRFQRPKPWPP